MRSKIGTKSRLTAHLLALALLILMLVYVAPQRAGETHMKNSRQHSSQSSGAQPMANDPGTDPASLLVTSQSAHAILPRTDQEITHDATATLDQIRVPAEGRKTPPQPLRPPDRTGKTAADTPPLPHEAAATPEQAVPAVPSAHQAVTVSSVPAAHSETVEGASVQSVAGAPAPAEGEAAAPAGDQPEAADLAPTGGISSSRIASSESLGMAVNPLPADGQTQPPPQPQPDESGSLVVVDRQPLAALAPLANANLEVLGDGVYWLSSRHDLEKELAAVPEIGVLILLAPMPGYHSAGLDHVRTEVIPADPGDLTAEEAERFLHLTTETRKPVVAAALPGARGAAFFKGAYFLAKRNLSFDDMLREIDPELREAGDDRDDIVHRLHRQNEAAGK